LEKDADDHLLLPLCQFQLERLQQGLLEQWLPRQRRQRLLLC
jgi:hypothetical protein